MSEESILILNMLREGKITAEQADSLLRAVRETTPPSSPPSPAAPPSPAVPPSPAAPPSPDPAALDSMQAKLAELQGKLGDLQGKLGAAQAVKTAGQAASLAGKVLDHLPRPEMDMGKINKAVDEAMRGLNSLKNDALRTARTAARQAAQEARKAAREGRRSFKFDINLDFGTDSSEGRPVNSGGQPEAAETSRESISWAGAERLLLENPHGRIKVKGSESAGSAEAVVTKTAWAETESEARVLLQQIFLTHTVENGRCKIGVAAPQDARERLSVDYEITVPRRLPLEIVTTFGEIAAEGVSTALRAKSASGAVKLAQSWGEDGETHLTTASGNVEVSPWNVPRGVLTVETGSGTVTSAGFAGESIRLSSRSGDVCVTEAKVASAATFEATSGDVSVTGGSAESRASVRTQSGHASVHGFKAAQVQVETVSGDAEVREVSGILTVKTVSGDVEASGIESAAVSLLTVSGDARWAFAAPFGGSFAGTTVSGDLHLALRGDSDARIEMNTTSGDLSLSLPVTEAVRTERHAAGKMGAGTGSIRLQSVSGDLHVAE